MPGRLESGAAYLEEKGFRVKKDPNIKAIIATNGGYGSQRLLSWQS